MAKRARTTETEAPVATAEGWRRVNRSQLATLIGCHPETVSAYVRQGMPVESPGGHGVESVYDAPACLKWWRDTQSKVSAKDAEQTRAFKEAADAKALQNAVTRGQLVDAEAVRVLGEHYTKGWASQVRSLARRARQAGVVTTAEDEDALNELARQILTEIASWKTAADVARASKGAAA